jgi:1-acyl-sn-glycerol-3-phosphate acyltransferase
MADTPRRYFKPLLRVRGLLFWVPVALTLGVFGPVVCASYVVPLEWRYRIVRFWTLLTFCCLRAICGLGYRVQWHGELPPGGKVIFCKHSSTWETFALNVVLGPIQVVWVLKRELLRIPVFGWGLAAMNSIAIDRASGRQAVQQMIDQGRDRLARGISVVVFPEGTRVRPGHQVRYKLGGAILAEATGVPVIPVAHNAGDFWPRHSLIKWPGEIELHVGPAIDPTGKSAQQINEEARAWIEGKMAEITRLDRFPY